MWRGPPLLVIAIDRRPLKATYGREREKGAKLESGAAAVVSTDAWDAREVECSCTTPLEGGAMRTTIPAAPLAAVALAFAACGGSPSTATSTPVVTHAAEVERLAFDGEVRAVTISRVEAVRTANAAFTDDTGAPRTTFPAAELVFQMHMRYSTHSYAGKYADPALPMRIVRATASYAGKVTMTAWTIVPGRSP